MPPCNFSSFSASHHKSMRLSLIVLAVLLFLPGRTFSQDGPSATALTAGSAITRDLSGGQSHTFQVLLLADQFLNIEVEQKGIDVELILNAPEGATLLKADRPTGTEGREFISFIAPRAGVYKLIAGSLEKSAKPGKYILTVKDLRTAKDDDRLLIARRQKFLQAELIREDAVALARQPGDSGSLPAFEKMMESVRLLREASDLFNAARWTSEIGQMYSARGYSRAALLWLDQALLICREMNHQGGIAASLNSLGIAYQNLSEYAQAISSFEQSLQIRRQLNNRNEIASSLNNLGNVCGAAGETQRALDLLSECLELSREIKDQSAEAYALNNLAKTYYGLGDREKALECLKESLRLYRLTKNPGGVASVLSSLTRVASDLSVQEKLDYLTEARTAFKEINSGRGLAGVLNNQARLKADAGEFTQATEYFNQALAMMRQMGSRLGEATTLDSLGRLAHKQKQFTTARQHLNDALRIVRETGERLTEARTLYSLALLERDEENLEAARTDIEQALQILDEQRTKVASQELRSTFMASVQDYYEFYIDVLMRLRQSRVVKGEPAKTSEYLQAALEVSERARARSLRELLLESRADIRQGADSALLERERILLLRLGVLAEAQAQLLASPHSPAQAEALKTALTSARQELQNIEGRIRQQSPRYAALTQPQTLTVSEIQRELLDADTALLEYALGKDRSYLWVVTKNNVTGYTLPRRRRIENAARCSIELLTARNQRPEGETAAQRQARIARADELYPKAAQILSQMILKPAARQLTGKRLLIVADGALQYVPFAALHDPTMVRTQTLTVASTAKSRTTPTATSPSPPALVDPSAEMNADYDLSSLPDETRDADAAPASADGRSACDNVLTTPVLEQKRTAYRPLIQQHEIVGLPSASVLVEMRRHPIKRQEVQKSVAVLADPVFEANDDRITTIRIKAEKETDNYTGKKSGAQSANDAQSMSAMTGKKNAATAVIADDTRMLKQALGELRINRLPFTRREAEAITSFTSAEDSLKALDFSASRATAMSDALAQYRIVHFATHGYFDTQNPELSRLILSRFDEKGQPQKGNLLAPEIYNLKVPADLVVLSGCRTAIGRELRGEGIGVLTRGFMYAGASRVMASLWSVSDEGTSELMQRFYQGLLGENRQSPSEALRAAQLQLRQQPRWRAPYYWASFILQGEVK